MDKFESSSMDSQNEEKEVGTLRSTNYVTQQAVC